ARPRPPRPTRRAARPRRRARPRRVTWTGRRRAAPGRRPRTDCSWTSGRLLTGLVDDLGVGDLVVGQRGRTRRTAGRAGTRAGLRRLVQPLRELLADRHQVLV